MSMKRQYEGKFIIYFNLSYLNFISFLQNTILMTNFWHFCFILLLGVVAMINSAQIIIPLTYAFDPQSSRKYPIKLSFNSSQTTTPFPAKFLSLFNVNITMETKTTTNPTNQSVVIGLKQPSTFLTAVKNTYNVQPNLIQIGKDQYTQLVINGNNFVESTDEFIDGETYEVQAVQNFGDVLLMKNQRCYLIDDDKIYFDEYLLLEILNSMDKKNGITFHQDQSKNVIVIMGKIENFPKISFTRDQSIFEIQIRDSTINYRPRTNTQSVSYIGYKSLQKFSKFQMLTNQSGKSIIIFKRTSQLYQLYLFLGYFFIFTLIFIILSRSKLEQSMKFVRSVVDWVFFHNRQARVRVLRTQLQ